MENVIKKIVLRYYNDISLNISYIGGGFYGKVYLVELSKQPYKVVIKIQLFDGLGKKEFDQINILSIHSKIKMPQIYFLHNKDSDIPYDVLGMEYIEGVNAGCIDHNKIDEGTKNKIGDKIIDNLISYHNVINPDGFGEINSKHFCPNWNTYYKNEANSTLLQAKSLYNDNIIDNKTYKIICNAYDKFDNIFYLPVNEARLIHGDYNTWNILLNSQMTDVAGIIDPYNCCFADFELDLYQLDNANGKLFDLLNKYKSKVTLSENFELKRNFYEVFSEVMHFYNAYKVNIKIDTSTLIPQAEGLSKTMKHFNIK